MYRSSAKQSSRGVITVFGKISSPEYYYCIEELHRFTQIKAVAAVFNQKFSIIVKEIYET